MSRVAKIRRSPDLGTRAVYSVAYIEDGETIGYGYARGDQLAEWRTDLLAAGWAVNEVTTSASRDDEQAGEAS